MHYLLSLILTLFFALDAWAAEVDQFTYREHELKDSALVINKMANKALKIAIMKANEKGTCSEEKLFKELRQEFNNSLIGDFPKKVLRSPEVDRSKISLKKSIFRDWKPWDGLLLGSSSIVNNPLTLTEVIRIGDIFLGVDKLEHLFGQGHLYYKRMYKEKMPLNQILKKGMKKEKFILGGVFYVNGVHSYGDLVANFNGIRFWNQMLKKYPSLLEEDELAEVSPYIICKGNQWQAQEPIDLRDYFDEGVDETINCSKYGTKSGVRKMKNSLKRLGLVCPMDKELNKALYHKYRPYSSYLINQNGIEKINL